MATTTDFWGALDTKQLVERTPLSILREQAALLGKKTGNLVEARVETRPWGSDFKLTLKLEVPGLDNYTYELLAVSHPVTLYPVKEERALGSVLENEDAFVQWLRAKLSSPDTHRIIGHLLSQASS